MISSAIVLLDALSLSMSRMYYESLGTTPGLILTANVLKWVVSQMIW